MYRIVLFIVGFSCWVQMSPAQDSITINDAKVIRARSEITIGRYFNNLLNTISYTGAENTDIKELINQSFEDSDKRIFLNKQIAIADDISDPDYSNSSNSPDVPVAQYLNAFNTFYGKSDANSVYFSDVRSSPVKRGRNMYVNVYFTSYFKNICLSKPSTSYKPTNRVAEIFVQKGANNKWFLYISRIGFYNPADTGNDISDNIVLTDAKKTAMATVGVDEATDAKVRFKQYIDRAGVEEKRRNYPAAIGLYNSALELEPEKREMYEPRIKELNNSFRTLADLDGKYSTGDYKEAVRGYSELLKKPRMNSDYSNSDYYLGRAKCFDKMGQQTKSYNEQVKYYHQALDDYSKSYDYDNDNMETIRSRADLYKRMNRNVEALTEYRIYLTKDPTDMGVYQSMSDLHMISGNLDQAIKDSDPALAQNGLDPVFKSRLNTSRGVMYAQKKDYINAEEYFTKAIALDSNNGIAYYNRGLARIKMNRIPGAAGDLAIARRKGTGVVNSMEIDSAAQTIFERGVYALNLGKYDSALLFIDAAIAVNPTRSFYYYTRGECYNSKNNFTEAVNAYTLAIGLAASYSGAYYKRGLANLQLGKATEAIADFTKTLQYNPQSYLAQKGLGDAYFALGDYKNAAKSLEVCLEMNSLREAKSTKTVSEIYNTIGRAYFGMKNYPKALENDRKFLAFHPKDIPSSFNYEIGNIYLNMGKYDSAHSYLTRSYQTDPGNGYVLYSMASCIYLRGNKDESLKWFERSFKTNAVKRNFVDHDALLGSLQDDKRFKDLKNKYL